MNKEQFVANDLGTIIANQSITLANLQIENQRLKSQVQELQTRNSMLTKSKKDNKNN